MSIEHLTQLLLKPDEELTDQERQLKDQCLSAATKALITSGKTVTIAENVEEKPKHAKEIDETEIGIAKARMELNSFLVVRKQLADEEQIIQRQFEEQLSKIREQREMNFELIKAQEKHLFALESKLSDLKSINVQVEKLNLKYSFKTMPINEIEQNNLPPQQVRNLSIIDILNQIIANAINILRIDCLNMVIFKYGMQEEGNNIQQWTSELDYQDGVLEITDPIVDIIGMPCQLIIKGGRISVKDTVSQPDIEGLKIKDLLLTRVAEKHFYAFLSQHARGYLCAIDELDEENLADLNVVTYTYEMKEKILERTQNNHLCMYTPGLMAGFGIISYVKANRDKRDEYLVKESNELINKHEITAKLVDVYALGSIRLGQPSQAQLVDLSKFIRKIKSDSSPKLNKLSGSLLSDIDVTLPEVKYDDFTNSKTTLRPKKLKFLRPQAHGVYTIEANVLDIIDNIDEFSRFTGFYNCFTIERLPKYATECNAVIKFEKMYNTPKRKILSEILTLLAKPIKNEVLAIGYLYLNTTTDLRYEYSTSMTGTYHLYNDEELEDLKILNNLNIQLPLQNPGLKPELTVIKSTDNKSVSVKIIWNAKPHRLNVISTLCPLSYDGKKSIFEGALTNYTMDEHEFCTLTGGYAKVLLALLDDNSVKEDLIICNKSMILPERFKYMKRINKTDVLKSMANLKLQYEGWLEGTLNDDIEIICRQVNQDPIIHNHLFPGYVSRDIVYQFFYSAYKEGDYIRFRKDEGILTFSTNTNDFCKKIINNTEELSKKIFEFIKENKSSDILKFCSEYTIQGIRLPIEDDVYLTCGNGFKYNLLLENQSGVPIKSMAALRVARILPYRH